MFDRQRSHLDGTPRLTGISAGWRTMREARAEAEKIAMYCRSEACVMAALSRHSRETIRVRGLVDRRITIAGYIRFQRWRPEDGKWHGDSCGCPDDRCIGHHHDVDEECGCLPVVLDLYARSLDEPVLA